MITDPYWPRRESDLDLETDHLGKMAFGSQIVEQYFSPAIFEPTFNFVVNAAPGGQSIIPGGRIGDEVKS